MKHFDYNNYVKNNRLLKESYSEDRIYIGKPVKTGPLRVASDYLQGLEKNMKTIIKIADKNPDITAKSVANMVLKTFKDIRDMQKKGDSMPGDFSMNEDKEF